MRSLYLKLNFQISYFGQKRGYYWFNLVLFILKTNIKYKEINNLKFTKSMNYPFDIQCVQGCLVRQRIKLTASTWLQDLNKQFRYRLIMVKCSFRQHSTLPHIHPKPSDQGGVPHLHILDNDSAGLDVGERWMLFWRKT